MELNKIEKERDNHFLLNRKIGGGQNRRKGVLFSFVFF